MGNTPSTPTKPSRRSRHNDSATERAKTVIGDLQATFQSSVKKLEDQDHPAAQLLDSVCGQYFEHDEKLNARHSRSASFYSEDISEDDSRTISEDDTTLDTDYRSTKFKKDAQSVETASYQSDYASEMSRDPPRGSSKKKKSSSSSGKRRDDKDDRSYESEEDPSYKGVVTDTKLDVGPGQLSKPLASSFAKRCYFTKAGIGKTTQHYEGLTLTGNVVIILAAAMKLKGCPTICDEDLRRVEQTYPNQFSRLPDELLLSSGWRRISKYCHFSNKPIPDGIPFFHSKQRLHPVGGYYFLLAAAVGMVRPIDVEPLNRDTLVLLETDHPNQCDAAPQVLINDPEQWTLVDKFCFFSGGPINTDEDVYYQADFDGNPIYMLAFLSPSLTPEELYKLDVAEKQGETGLKSVGAVEEVESVYDLTERDFHDLKLYHLGPCRALPQYILQPQAWTKVLPPHFLAARQNAILRAQEYVSRHSIAPMPFSSTPENPLDPSHQRTVGATPHDSHVHDPQVETDQRYNENQNYFMPPPNHDQQTHDQIYEQQQQEQNYEQSHPDQSYEKQHLEQSYEQAPRQDQIYEQPPHQEQIYEQPHQPLYGQQSPLQPHMYEQSHQQPLYEQPQAQPQQALYEPTHHPTMYEQAHQQAAYEQSHQQPPYDQQANPQPLYDPTHQQPNQQNVYDQHTPQSAYAFNAPEGSYPNQAQGPFFATQQGGLPNTYHISDDSNQPITEHEQREQQQRHLDQEEQFQHQQLIQQQHQSQQQQDIQPVLQHGNQPLLSASISQEDQNRAVEEEGAFVDSNTPIDEAITTEMSKISLAENPSDSVEWETSNFDRENGQDTEELVSKDEQDFHVQNADMELQLSESKDEENIAYADEKYNVSEKSRDEEYIPPEDQYYDSPRNKDTQHEFFGTPSLEQADDSVFSPTNTELAENAVKYDDNQYENAYQEKNPNANEHDRNSYEGRNYDANGYNGNRYKEGFDGNEYAENDYEENELNDEEYAEKEYESQEYYDSPGKTVSSTDSAEYSKDVVSPIRMGNIRKVGAGDTTLSPQNNSVSSSPRSEYSHTSAMRGAQELLRKNRQRRQERARRMNDVDVGIEDDYNPPSAVSPGDHLSPTSQATEESGGTWESGSEVTSVVSGSSAWTDTSNATDRGSRRALILQMAKARMKSNKDRSGNVSTTSIAEEFSDSYSQGNEINKLPSQGGDIDFSADLD